MKKFYTCYDRIPNRPNMIAGIAEDVLVGLKHDKPIIWRMYERKKKRGNWGEN